MGKIDKIYVQFLKLGILCFLIEFKHITILNLNIFRKYNIVCLSLVNATMCLNLIEKPNVPNLRNCI